MTPTRNYQTEPSYFKISPRPPRAKFSHYTESMVPFTDQPRHLVYHQVTEFRSVTTVLVKSCDCLRNQHTTEGTLFPQGYSVLVTTLLQELPQILSVYKILNGDYEANAAPSQSGKQESRVRRAGWSLARFPTLIPLTTTFKRTEVAGIRDSVHLKSNNFQPGLCQQHLSRSNACWKQPVFPGTLISISAWPTEIHIRLALFQQKQKN